MAFKLHVSIIELMDLKLDRECVYKTYVLWLKIFYLKTSVKLIIFYYEITVW